MYKNLIVYAVVVLISICSAAVQAANANAESLEMDPALLSKLALERAEAPGAEEIRDA